MKVHFGSIYLDPLKKKKIIVGEMKFDILADENSMEALSVFSPFLLQFCLFNLFITSADFPSLMVRLTASRQNTKSQSTNDKEPLKKN